MSKRAELIAEVKERHYARLKDTSPDLYRRAIEAAEGVTLQHGLSTRIGADVEWAVVYMTLEALDMAR